MAETRTADVWGAAHVLEIFGLDEVQEAVYLTLLDLPSVSDADLRERHPDLSGERIETALADLERDGLAARSQLPGDGYVAVAPDVALLDWLRRRTSVLHDAQSVIGELTERYQAVSRHPDRVGIVEVTRGRPAIERWRRCIADARREVRVFEHPPFDTVYRTGWGGESSPTELHLLATGVRFRVVYDRAAVDIRPHLGDLRSGIEAGEEARVLGDLPLRMALVDDQLALLPLRDGHVLSEGMLTVRPSALLSALSALFESVWQYAPPLLLDPVAGAEEPKLDESLTTIAGLLAAGLSDQAIARQLGVSVRTVERRTRRLATTLGAKTRYQAGVLAARHGWI